MNELYVVPGDRHVERLAREGKRAETRGSLRARLAAALLPDRAFAEPRVCRLALAAALAEPAASAAQMDLFTTVAPGAAVDSPLLAAARGRGGTTWVRFVTAVDAAVTGLRSRGATVAHLRRVADRGAGVTAARAGTLAIAMDALDERLARAGLVDGRLLPGRLAAAVTATAVEDLVSAVSARCLRARWLFAWDPVDLAWWRALDEKLARASGWARISLPAFDRPLEGARDRDPLEIVAEEVARGLDAPPETETIEPVLGDLSGVAMTVGSDRHRRVRLVRAVDAVGQARAAGRLVMDALERGAAVEKVAIAVPSVDEHTLVPLRRALYEAGVVVHEARGAPASTAPVVTAAVLALQVANELERTAVARLLQCGYLDISGVVPGVAAHDVEWRLARLARALERSPTATGEDAVVRLVRTAASQAADASLLEAVAQALQRSRIAKTRGEHVAATQRLWGELGISSLAGRGGLSTFGRDEPPTGVARAERLAIARDARAWDALVAALELYERTCSALGAASQVVDREVFRAELLELLDDISSRPGAARAGAVRVASLAELAGEELDLLVVLDANEGLLPRDERDDPLLSDALCTVLARQARGTYTVRSQGEGRARELTALAVAAAGAADVALVFCREDAAGAPLGASVVVEVLARAGIPMEPTSIEPYLPAFGAAAVRAAREREREAFFFDPARPRSDIVGRLAESEGARAVLTAETGGLDRPLSVTGLERFARCPFMGFAYVVLAAREPDVRDELPDAREEGTLVHEALAAAFTATRDLWPRRPRDAAAILGHGLEAADAVSRAAAAHAPLRSVAHHRVRAAVAILLRAAADDEGWSFDVAEQGFGGARGRAAVELWPPLELQAGGERLVLRGTIDRVDRGRDGATARVVDYKRTKATVRNASNALGETALQVPLYACVTSRRLGLPTTGAYVSTRPQDVAAAGPRSAVKLEQAVAALVERGGSGDDLAAVERHALAVVTAVRRGDLVPVPADETECRMCPVSGGCRKPRFAMAPTVESEEAS